MQTPHFLNATDTPSRRRLRAKREQDTRSADQPGLYVASIYRTVQVSDVLYNPSIGVLISEDVCLCSAVSDWEARKPSRFSRHAWRAWCAEAAEFEDKRLRLVGLAVAAGLSVPPAAT